MKIKTRQPDPTEEQIREACRQIQEGWSELDWQRRSTYETDRPVVVPVVRVADMEE